MSKEILVDWVEEALRGMGGKGSVIEVARAIWQVHEVDLRRAGDLFYTWQYDYRWAATKLRKAGRMKAADAGPAGVWELAPEAMRKQDS